VHPLHLWHTHHPLNAARLQHPWPFALATGLLVFVIGLALDLIANGHLDHAHVTLAVALGWIAGVGVASSRTRTKPTG
jgi:hypothetical protein